MFYSLDFYFVSKLNTVDRTIAKTRVTYDKQAFKLKIVFKSIINHRVSNFLL